MSRWEPHAKQRLELAALHLYATQGYEATTIGDISAHVGVTARTFFRHFPDKREILFSNADTLRDHIAASLRDAPVDMLPLDVAVHAMSACDELFNSGVHQHLRQRNAIIASSSELQEREAHKLATIATVVANALVERGLDPVNAQLVADVALAVFKQAARLWMDDPTTSYAVQVDRAAAQAGAVMSAQTRGTPPQPDVGHYKIEPTVGARTAAPAL